MSENWTPPTPAITVGDINNYGRRFIEAVCSECRYTVATSRPADVDGFVVGEKIIRDHLETHAPWRAPDIEIDWVLQASCSICEDGGNVKQECSSVILCSTCGTRWGIDGTYGERWAS